AGGPTQQLRLGQRKRWRGAHSDRARHGIDRPARLAGCSARQGGWNHHPREQGAREERCGSAGVGTRTLPSFARLDSRGRLSLRRTGPAGQPEKEKAVRSKMSFANSIIAAGFLLVLAAVPLCAQGARGPIMGGGIMSPPVNQRPPGLEFVGIEQHLNAEVPANLEFRDELGNPVKLADYFGHGRPVILNLGYYQCPMLCSELLQGLVGSMKALTFNLGKDFDVLTVSFDPRETTEMAAEKKRDMMKRYGRANAGQGWHFLTGKADQINALTKSVGFQYQFDEKTGQYAHAT